MGRARGNQVVGTQLARDTWVASCRVGQCAAHAHVLSVEVGVYNRGSPCWGTQKGGNAWVEVGDGRDRMWYPRGMQWTRFLMMETVARTVDWR